jgi:dipeptidyl aminopeptidase/acylaminoacyl peptidase
VALRLESASRANSRRESSSRVVVKLRTAVRFFDRTAPLTNAGWITKPLFVVAGLNDPRVPHTEAEQMVARVKQNGSPVWFLMANDEGYGFRKKGNRDYQFYATVLFVRQFLMGAGTS